MPANGKHEMRKSAAHALPKCNAHVLESLQLHKLRIFVGGYIHLQVQCRNLVQQFDTVLPVVWLLCVQYARAVHQLPEAPGCRRVRQPQFAGGHAHGGQQCMCKFVYATFCSVLSTTKVMVQLFDMVCSLLCDLFP